MNNNTKMKTCVTYARNAEPARLLDEPHLQAPALRPAGGASPPTPPAAGSSRLAEKATPRQRRRQQWRCWTAPSRRGAAQGVNDGMSRIRPHTVTPGDSAATSMTTPAKSVGPVVESEGSASVDSEKSGPESHSATGMVPARSGGFQVRTFRSLRWHYPRQILRSGRKKRRRCLSATAASGYHSSRAVAFTSGLFGVYAGTAVGSASVDSEKSGPESHSATGMVPARSGGFQVRTFRSLRWHYPRQILRSGRIKRRRCLSATAASGYHSSRAVAFTSGLFGVYAGTAWVVPA